MKSNLISNDNHSKLLEIYKNYPNLSLQNKGYEGIWKDKLTEIEQAKFKEVETILKETVFGFSSFQNFRLSKDNEIQLRFQYDWTAHDRSLGIPFVGVGYILLDELLNGFRE